MVAPRYQVGHLITAMRRLISPFMKKLLLLAAALLLSMALLLTYTQPSSWLIRKLIVRERPQSADAIVVLLGGAASERVELARSLYKEGFAPKIIFCNGFEVSGVKSWWYNTHGWIPFGKSFRTYLHRHGVSDGAIDMLNCPGIHDTASEIRAIGGHLNGRRYSRIILVTSGSHSRRAKIVWESIIPAISPITIGSRDAGLKWWWSTRRGRSTVLYEYLALAKEVARQHIQNQPELTQAPQ